MQRFRTFGVYLYTNKVGGICSGSSSGFWAINLPTLGTLGVGAGADPLSKVPWFSVLVDC